MIFFVLILLLLIFNKAEISKAGEFNKEYISPDGTLAIKGIFVALILLSHGKGYIELGGVYDEAYIALQNHLNQMVVAMFLFYSGYGMMESIKKKQFAYIKTIPTKRFPNLLLNYDIAVLFFFVLEWAIGNKYSIKELLIALTSWRSIGNSSWYIFVILVSYIFTFIVFLPKLITKNKVVEFLSIVVLTILEIALMLTLKKVGMPKYFYDTAVLFALGFWYSYFKDIIEKYVMKNDIFYATALTGIIIIYIYSYLHRWDRLLMYTIWGICFCGLVVLLSMKISLQNSILKFLGSHIFSIYILQRIPMIILDYLGVSSRHKYIFLIASFAIAIVISLVYDQFTDKLSKLIWKPKKIEKQ